MKIIPSCYDITFDDGEEFQLILCHQKDGSILWKISNGVFCLSKGLIWDREPFPSSRTDEYLKETRFKYDEAIDLLLNWKEKNK